MNHLTPRRDPSNDEELQYIALSFDKLGNEDAEINSA